MSMKKAMPTQMPRESGLGYDLDNKLSAAIELLDQCLFASMPAGTTLGHAFEVANKINFARQVLIDRYGIEAANYSVEMIREEVKS
jgi:hypothetical protein